MHNQKESERHEGESVMHSSGKIFPDGPISELVRIPSGEINFDLGRDVR